MKYKCLITDHDDTLVNSTAEVHYPCMVECLKELRPDVDLTFDEFTRVNFDLGFQGYVEDILHFTPQESQRQMDIWREWTAAHRPSFFPDVSEVLHRFKAAGGIIAVSSHSEKDVILKDYLNGGCPLPDAIYGWDLKPENRKPSVYTVERVEEKFGLAPTEIVMLDDMQHGLSMCRDAGVDFIFADWTEKPDYILDYMTKNSTYTAKSMKDVENILFCGS